MKKLSSLISMLLTASMLLTGCNYHAAMNSIPPEVAEKYLPYQSMGETDKPGSDAPELNIKGNVAEGFDPSLGDYVCGKENCPGHKQTSPMEDGWEVCSDEYEQEEPDEIVFYCQDEECPGHEYGDQECVDTFTIDMSFVGDVMLATYMGQYYEGSFSWYAENKDPSYFFEKVYDVFSTDDFTIVNLENVLTDSKLKEVAKDHNPAYWYRGPTKNTNILKAGSIEAVSLANNHFSDYGNQGRIDTRAALDKAGIPWGWNDKIMYLEKNGFKIAVICHGLWNEWQADPIVNQIKEAEKNSDYQIVFYHGGKERIHAPEEWKVRATHKLVDAGADLVIGNHPHVLQPTEVYNGVNIVYSLGNFCFGGSRKPENRTVIYKAVITVDENKEVINEAIDIIPCYVYVGETNNWQPDIITDDVQKQRVLDFMYGKVDSPL